MYRSHKEYITNQNDLAICYNANCNIISSEINPYSMLVGYKMYLFKMCQKCLCRYKYMDKCY